MTNLLIRDDGRRVKYMLKVRDLQVLDVGFLRYLKGCFRAPHTDSLHAKTLDETTTTKPDRRPRAFLLFFRFSLIRHNSAIRNSSSELSGSSAISLSRVSLNR
jgi:hypothetical protein